jgi:hypothetical protein
VTLRVVLAAASTVALMATGCATQEVGVATPGTITVATSATSAPEPTPGVPRVRDPLDASRYIADPCAILTPEKLASYGMNRTGKPDVPSTTTDFREPGCLWHGNAQSFNVAVNWLTSNKNGLADTYVLQESETWDYFEAIEVEEYPAVFNYFSDDPQYGNCHVTVGISDRLVYTVYIQGQGNIDAQTGCDLVIQVATAVIQMLKENP